MLNGERQKDFFKKIYILEKNNRSLECHNNINYF